MGAGFAGRCLLEEDEAPDVFGVVRSVGETSLRRRYSYKLASNVVGFLASLVSASVIPRSLGPAAYGSFGFLSNFASQLTGFFDSGTSLGFYVKLTQRPRDTGLLRFYWGFVALVTLTNVLLVSTVFGLQLQAWIWPDQQARYVWMAIAFGLITWYGQIVGKIVDAHALTAQGEVIQIQQRILGTILIVAVFWFYRFGLAEYFAYQYLLVAFTIVACWRLLGRHHLAILPRGRLKRPAVVGYTREFVEYAGPLVSLTFVGLIIGIGERWLLQAYAGSVEQGFFSLSSRVGAMCLLFTSAMTPLLSREFSKAYGTRDLARMRALFSRYIPMLYFVAAFLASFMAVQARNVSFLLGGRDFSGAALPISIMVFYPIFQTYGQLSGSVFYATDQTALYRNMSLITNLAGLPLTFWLLAPEPLMGLNLASTGLALKTVLVAAIGVNVQLWFNARFLSISFRRLVGHQIYSVGLLCGCAWIATKASETVARAIPVRFVIAGMTYTAAVAVLVLVFPSLISSSRAELISLLREMNARLRA